MDKMCPLCFGIGWVVKTIPIALGMQSSAAGSGQECRADAIDPAQSETEFNGIGGLLTYIGDGPRLSNRRRLCQYCYSGQSLRRQLSAAIT